MDKLIQYLKDNPTIEVVYLNSEGEFTIQVDILHPIEKTRDEILKTKTAPATDPSKSKTDK